MGDEGDPSLDGSWLAVASCERGERISAELIVLMYTFG